MANKVYTHAMAKAQDFATLKTGDLFTYPGKSEFFLVGRYMPSPTYNVDTRYAIDLRNGDFRSPGDREQVIRLKPGTTIHIDQGE